MPVDPTEAPVRPPVDDPSGSIRFLSRADLGEQPVPPSTAPPADLPFTTLPEGRSALPFPSKPPAEPDWGLDEVPGVPLGLPRLLADDDALKPLEPLTFAEDEPPKGVAEVAPVSELQTEPLPDDVFALGGEEDDISEEWTAEASEEIEPPPAPSLAPATDPSPTGSPELAALRAEVAALQGRVWMAAAAGAVVGGVLTALLLLSL